MEFRSLLSRHAALAVEKQLALVRSVAGSAWSWDLASGRLEIGKTPWAFQLLGITREEDGRWRWAWADAAPRGGEGVAPELLVAANLLRGFGLRNGVRELVEAEVERERVDGPSIAALACGLLDARGWWRAPFPGGVAWLLLTDRAELLGPAPTPAEMARVLTRTLAVLPVDHGIALASYVVHHGGSIEYVVHRGRSAEETGATTTARLTGGDMVAHFDARRRIERLEARVA